MTETWFNDDTVQNIPDYTGFHIYRTNRVGGGVSVYVRNKYPSKLLSDCSFLNPFCEVCTVNIQISNIFSLNIIGIYRPPNTDDGRYFCDILRDNILSKFQSSHNIMLCGDTNINLCENNPVANYYNDMLYSKSLVLYITIPTRVTESSFSNIDHIWSNIISNVSAGVFENNISDHYTVFACIYNVKSESQRVIKKFRDHSTHCVELFRTELINILENFNVYDGLDVDLRTDIFNNILLECYNKCCPIRSKILSRSKLFRPWFDHDLKVLCDMKHNLYKQYRRGIVNCNSYKIFNSDFKNLVKRSKLNYFRNKFQSCSNEIKKTWKTINDFIGCKRRRSLSEIIKEGVSYSSDSDIANCFNSFFGSIASNLRNNIPNTNRSPLSYMGNREISSIQYHPTSAAEVEVILDKLKITKGNIYSVPVFILKKVTGAISPILSALFNSSINESLFPSLFKTATVTPVHKTGSYNDVKMYRPISILPTLSKVFERLIYNRLLLFFNDNNTLNKHQFGFRKGLCTIDAVTELLESYYDSLNSGKFHVSVFLDLSKAFDTLDHGILISKLDHVGIRGNILRWLNSYLSGRQQCVSVNSKISSMCHILSGVPQGSILGPLLFLIYINDMAKSAPTLHCVHFADDSTVSVSGEDIYDIFDILNNELSNIRVWIQTNKLSLNAAKTTYMVITNKCFPENLQLKIGDSILNRV